MRHIYPVTESSAGNIDGTTNRFGFYPVGRLNTWHGGLHIEGDYKVRAIADGKIIAFRLSKEYKIASIDGVEYKYSNCFVLIEHCIKQPQKDSEPANNGTAANGAPPPATDDILLTYYSLYHHLIPQSEMGQDKIPEIFQKAAYKTKAKTMERKTPDKNGVSNGEIAANTIVLLESKKEGADKKWRQLKNYNGTSSVYNGYLHLPDLDETIACNVKDEDYDTVAQNEIPVRAGTIIGYTGLYETERVANYITTHVDIFTCNAKKTKDFIDNAAKNGLHQQFFLRIKVGTQLIMAYPPYSIPVGYNLTVLAKGDTYTKIKKHSLSKVVLKKDLSPIPGIEANPAFHPKSLAKLNGDFDGMLTSTSRLIYEEKKDEGQGPNKIEKRQVRFEFDNSPELWVKNSFLGANTEQTGLFTLSTELTEFFYEEPSSTANETIQDLQIIELHETHTVKDSNGQTWYYIKCEDKGENGTTVTRKGWLKSDANDAKQKISAYDWTEFGFKIIEDNSDEHFYECGASGFIDTLCKEMDTDKSKSLDQRELQQAFKQPLFARKLSRLICYHTSEWSYTKDKLPQIKDIVTKKMDAEIDKETDSDIKEKMKTLKTDRLNDLETRISDLDFWDKITQNTTFPVGDPKVYHFHPIAFIDQMKKMSCFCYRDITVQAFEQIFGKGPWFKKANSGIHNISTADLIIALNNTMKKYDINTCLQKAYFLAQCRAETGYDTTIEGADGSDYDPGTFKTNHDLYQKYLDYLSKYGGENQINKEYETCKAGYDTYELNRTKKGFDLISYKIKHDKYAPFLVDKNLYNSYKIHKGHYDSYNNCIGNGNTTIGDGSVYKGRGLIQLTWKSNYQKYKTETGIDCITKPELISNNLENSCDVSGWFWENRRLNNHADNDDLLMVTYRINGAGMYGFDDRYRFTKNCIEKLNVKQCPEYEHLKLGEYSLDTSNFKNSSYIYSEKEKKRRTNNETITKNKLIQAKKAYFNNPPQ